MRLEAVTLLAVALCSPSFGQVACGPRDQVMATLAARYDETRRASGMAVAGPQVAVMELFASHAGTWTMTITTADGQMCLVASGDGFHAEPGGVAG